MLRHNTLSAERANSLGAHAAEAENEIRFAINNLSLNPLETPAKCLLEALQRLSLIRQECYFE